MSVLVHNSNIRWQIDMAIQQKSYFTHYDFLAKKELKKQEMRQINQTSLQEKPFYPFIRLVVLL